VLPQPRKEKCPVNNVSFLNGTLSISKTVIFEDNCIVVGTTEYKKCEVQSTGIVLLNKPSIKMLFRYTHGTDGGSRTACWIFGTNQTGYELPALLKTPQFHLI